ncbi:MAG: hypothetical protein ETSY2_02055 [Candidatus Entotheonella gemina]|uniref:Uncharacterized protein n=1 Tax=Candidatus Entotheonella gemina TaxID=1429439 RepID=W4MFL2_9BACT|nr:MAG: hypothetical protein ETSY2_02055 [Candidatus Entotheonella gemina]
MRLAGEVEDALIEVGQIFASQFCLAAAAAWRQTLIYLERKTV